LHFPAATFYPPTTHILAAPVPGAWPLKVTVNIHFFAANLAVFPLSPRSPNFLSPLAF